VGTSLAGERTRDRGSSHVGGRSAFGCAPAFDVAGNPTTIHALLRVADAGTRERLTSALQRRHGNAAVERLLAPSAAPVQRWAVRLPRGTADCARVVGYLDANSPHRADSGWAKTNVRFSWGGDPSFTDEDGVITATVSNPTVTKTMSVDMPQWSPTDPAMARAWTSMYGTLRAHEAEHERIGNEWETTLRTRLAGLSVTVSARTLAAFNAAVRTEWNGWLAEHQADQRAIDPFTAVLDCSGGASESEAAAPDLSGQLGGVEE
jgi:predicted secreted Zn-dependent protease